MADSTPKTVEYFAKSMFSSVTIGVNASVLAMLAAILTLEEVRVLVPMQYMPLFTAVLAILNIWIRTQTVRPVAMMAPGDVKGVEVKKLKATMKDTPPPDAPKA